MVSALEDGKRVIPALRAVSKVQNAFLVIAGDGILREEVDNLAAELLPGRYMRRTYPHEQMPDLYRCANVFLHTTIGESFGNVYIEAPSSGVPVVAHDEQITRWILGDHASLLNTRSVDDVAEAIQSIFDSRPSNLTGASTWARERYGWHTVARSYQEFLEAVRSRYLGSSLAG